MPPCTIQLKKGRDGKSTLTVIRADGSRTWSRLGGVAQPSFFPEHDLMHLAVESVLGATEAFFGLIASGWSIDDFAAPRAGRPRPAVALVFEMIVGQFDLDRGQGTRSNAAELNERIALAFSARGISAPALLTDDEVAAVWRMHGALVTEWRGVEPGGTMEVGFPYMM